MRVTGEVQRQAWLEGRLPPIEQVRPGRVRPFNEQPNGKEMSVQDQIADKLRKEKYTLGEVKKLTGDLWQIPARIQYGEKDVTIPIVLPIKWAGDTPMVVVDSLPLPGFGTVSARVMFFEGHYAGYWKHGRSGR